MVRLCGRGFVVLSMLLAVTACSNGDETAAGGRSAGTTTTAVLEPPFAVETLTETLVDATRTADRQPERRLETIIRYPDVEDEPFPLIVFAHGFMDHPRAFAQLTTAWAAAGYVVAAPAFPLTRDDAVGGPNPADLPEQPGDVRFVIDEVTRLAAEEGHPLVGRLDLDRVGVAGHGLGVTTVLAPAFHSCCRDDRIDAVLALSGVVLDLEGTYEFDATPLLVLFGANDEYLPPATGADLYGRAQGPRLLGTIAGGTHYGPYRDEPAPSDDVIEALTAGFWDRFLAGRGSASDLLAAPAADGLVTLEHDLG